MIMQQQQHTHHVCSATARLEGVSIALLCYKRRGAIQFLLPPNRPSYVDKRPPQLFDNRQESQQLCNVQLLAACCRTRRGLHRMHQLLLLLHGVVAWNRHNCVATSKENITVRAHSTACRA